MECPSRPRRAGIPRRATAVLTKAIGYFSRAGYEIRLPELYLERARASRAARRRGRRRARPEGGDRDLRAAPHEILAQTTRVSYFDTAHEMLRRDDEPRSRPWTTGFRPRLPRKGKDQATSSTVGARRSLSASSSCRTRSRRRVAIIAYGVAVRPTARSGRSRTGSRELTEERRRGRDLERGSCEKFREEIESAAVEAHLPAAARLYEVLIDPIAAAPRRIRHGRRHPRRDPPRGAVRRARRRKDEPILRGRPSHRRGAQHRAVLAGERQSRRRDRSRGFPPRSWRSAIPPSTRLLSRTSPRLIRSCGGGRIASRGSMPTLSCSPATQHRPTGFLSELGRHTVVHVASPRSDQRKRSTAVAAALRS